MENLIQILGVIGGGSAVTLITLFINQSNKKHEQRSKTIEDSIEAWQKIADDTKRRLEALEQRLDIYEKYITALQMHIAELERLIVISDPKIKLPERPVLDKKMWEDTKNV